MGVAGIKQLSSPSKIASFSGKLNEEAILKVSFKNIDWFQKFFFCISGCNFIGLFNDILFVFVLSVLFDVQSDLCLAKTDVVYLSFRDCNSNPTKKLDLEGGC